MPQCPVCLDELAVDQQTFEQHVNAHFEEPEQADESSSRPTAQNSTCFVCGTCFGVLEGKKMEEHVNACLDAVRTYDAAERDGAGDGWTSERRDAKCWKGKQADKGDQWWDPLTDSVSAVPSNFSPNVVQTLASVLAAAHARKATRAAVLCRPGVVHMRGTWTFDKAWGCGYRNTLMALSALLDAVPAYRPLFSAQVNGCLPGVRRVQGWIEEAWDQGFDLQGKEQLRGKLLGTRKWIGVSDIAAMFLAKGIPCQLYDFPQPRKGKGRPAHQALHDWVVAYFSDAAEPGVKSDNVFSVMMAGNDRQAVRVSNKLPLILQHAGHSRTIIGYETNNRGDTNLLLFDPGRPIPKDIRKTSLEGLGDSDQSVESGAINKHGKRSVSDGHGSPTKHTRADDDASGARKAASKPTTSSVDWQTNPVKALKPFRINLGTLSAHTEYQILAFPGSAPMSEADRLSSKVLTSEIKT